MSSGVEQTQRDQPVAAPFQGATALYRFFDTADRLLYVGITDTPSTRWNHHRLHAGWWSQAVAKSVKWISGRGEAAAAELVAIRTESPLWNTAAAPVSNERLNIVRFEAATNGGMRSESGEWRNSDVAIVQVLSAEIRQGRLSAGDRLPSLSALTVRFGVSPRTARQAILLLVEDGLAAVEGSGTARRYFVAADTGDADWRPPPLPDGRDALEALLATLQASPVCLSSAANAIGLHLSIVRGWGQRHPHVAEMMERAMCEGQRSSFDLHKRTGLKDAV